MAKSLATAVAVRRASSSSSSGPPVPGIFGFNESTIRYDDQPVMVAGIMESRHGNIVRERIYFGDPWEPPAWRAQWVELYDPLAPDSSHGHH